MTDLAALPPAVRAYVRGYVLRDRRLSVARGFGAAAAVFVGVMLATCLLDRFLHFPPAVRGGLLAAAGLTALALVLRPLLRLGRPGVDWLAAAERIERQDPRFGQRLLTVASRAMGRSEYRGSDELLDQLAYEVDRQAAAERPAALLPARAALGPWAVLAGLVVAAYGLARLPDLNLPQLGLRFLTPWRDIDPVTTTRLAVAPGQRDLPQGAAVRIEATVDRLGVEPVWLHIA